MRKMPWMKQWGLTAIVIGMALSGCCGIRKSEGPSNICQAVASGDINKVRLAVGWSQAEDPSVAAAQAVNAARQMLGTDVKGIVFYESYEKAADAEKVPAAVWKEVGSEAPMIGVSAEPLVNGGHLGNNAFAVLLIGGEKAAVQAVCAPLDRERDKTGSAIGDVLKKVNHLKLVIALAEPLLSFEEGVTVEDFLHGMKKTLPGHVALWGGNGKPIKENKPQDAYTFYGTRMLTGHVVAMGIGGSIGLAATHTTEYIPVGKPVTVTKVDAAEPKIALEFDGKPANRVYREIRGMSAETKLAPSSPANMIGVVLTQNHIYTRGILEEIPATGGLRFITSIPVGTRMQIMKGGDSAERIYQSARDALTETLGKVPAGASPLLALPSDCCARGFALAKFTDGKGDEVLRGMKPAMGTRDIPVFGFYAYGELGPLAGEYKGLPYQYMQQTFTFVLLYDK